MTAKEGDSPLRGQSPSPDHSWAICLSVNR